MRDAQWGAGRTTGAVLGVPIPREAEADPATIDAAIADGLAAAEAAHVTGYAVTPFLLAHIADATGGASLAANVALVREYVGNQAANVRLVLDHQHRPPDRLAEAGPGCLRGLGRAGICTRKAAIGNCM